MGKNSAKSSEPGMQHPNQLTTNIEKSRKDLNELVTQFDILEFNDKKFEDIKASVAVVNQEFRKILAEYQNSLIGKEYKFEFKELPIKVSV